MKKLLLCICAAFCAHPAYSQAEPVVAVNNIAIAHEQKGWRVTSASTTPIRFNLLKDDLIVRIDGRNAAETGPMLMASLFNQQYRRDINLFIERSGSGMETSLREIPAQDYSPIGANPFRHVADGFDAPVAELKDIDGQALTIEGFKGKWVLIDFMATWCAPYMETLPKFLSVANRNQLNLLMIALNDKADALRRIRQDYQIHAPIVMTQFTAQLPIAFGIATNRWTGEIPGFVLIRPDGEVALIEVGVNDPDHLEKTLECLMSSKADEASK